MAIAIKFYPEILGCGIPILPPLPPSPTGGGAIFADLCTIIYYFKS
jgi:hypothetical protein